MKSSSLLLHGAHGFPAEPNCNKLYLHVPWVAEHLFRLNNALMRDERNALDEHFKYRLSMVASRANECPYCVSHHACLLKRRWDYTDEDLAELHVMNLRVYGAFDHVASCISGKFMGIEVFEEYDSGRVRKAALDPTEILEATPPEPYWLPGRTSGYEGSDPER